MKEPSFYKSLDKRKSATIYFTKWDPSVQQFISDQNYRVALQLDEKMNPSPDNDLELPNIKYLSAISDENLVVDYLNFLEDYSRTIGFRHLVLPDTAEFGVFEKEVILLANKNFSIFLPVELHYF